MIAGSDWAPPSQARTTVRPLAGTILQKKDPAAGPHVLEDITYISPTDEDWLYPAARETVGHSMVDHQRASLMADALTMAVGGSGLQPGFLRWITGARCPTASACPASRRAPARGGRPCLPGPSHRRFGNRGHRAASAECECTQRR
ncbi:hypothetical protein GCM10023238_12940 [Streptomyces heliomycini]